MTDESYADPALRDALGSLLLDEPPAPPIVDDVARGRARQRRRRARVGAGLGLAAAVVMGVAVVGPLRPRDAVVQPGGTAPTAPGVSPEWFAGITPALLDRITGVVDWDQSTVQGSASTGFLADLTIVPVAVTMNGENRTVELLPGNGRTGRMTLQWMPGRTGPGPALARCPVAACPEQGPTGFVGGQIDMGATAGPDAGFPEGTVIIDRQYPQGLLELVNYPSAPPATLPPSVRDWAYIPGVIATEFLTDLGNPVATPEPTASSSADAGQPLDAVRSSVELFLAGRGWIVVGENRPTISDGTGREELDLVVRPAGSGDTAEPSSVYVVIDRENRGAGHYASACTADTCDPGPPVLDCGFGGVDRQCAQSLLPNTSVGPLDWGSMVVDWHYRDGALVEVVVGPDPVRATEAPLGPTPFLDEDETRALLAAIGNPYGAPVPVTAVRPCRDDDVKLIPAVDPDYQRGRRSMVVEVHARNPQVRCTVTGTPGLQLLGVDDQPLPFTVVRDTFSPIAAVLVTQERTPAARVLVSQPTCRSADVAPASSLRVTLPGESVSTLVEVPDGLTLEYCVGGAGDPGLTVTESPFLAVPPGGAPTSAPTP